MKILDGSLISFRAVGRMGPLIREEPVAEEHGHIRGAWRGDFTIICNTNGAHGGISAEICLSWYASAAKAADGKRLAVDYAADSYTCANLPAYSSALAPVYVGLAR
jgi:hypothetical protein